jgi:guanylate kinase
VTPRIVVLAAPSGGGKTTIAKALVAARPDVGFSVSATTRPARPGEREGEAYHFVSRDEFARRRAAGEFLESAEYAGHWYGTLRSEIERLFAAGKHVLLDIEIKGARQVRQHGQYGPRCVAVFILPPGAKQLASRLSDRRTDSPAKVRRRLELAREEIREANEFDYVIVNDDLRQAIAAVARLIDGAQDVPPRPDRFENLVRELEDQLGTAIAMMDRS